MSFLHLCFSYSPPLPNKPVFLTYSCFFMNIVLYYVIDPVGVAWRGVYIGAKSIDGKV